MYAKLIIALCAVGLARAGYLHGAAPIAYSGHAYTAPVATYAHAPAVVTRTVSPAVSSVSAYSTDIAHGSPVATYSAPVVARAYAAPAYSAYTAPVATYAAAAPVYNSLAYSAAPAVSHIGYSGYGANYGW